MRIRTDDEVYRVDAVWLGPPKATFPWRARYVAWGIGLVVFLLTVVVERQIGIGIGVFSVAWALVITVALTKLIGSKINHERPLGATAVMMIRELNTPRQTTEIIGGAVGMNKVRISHERPRPKVRQPKQPKQRASKKPAQPQPTPQPQWQYGQWVNTGAREVRGVRTQTWQ